MQNNKFTALTMLSSLLLWVLRLIALILVILFIMRSFIILLVLLPVQNLLFAQLPQGITAKTKIYLVRHAEKDTGNNPSLTQNGKKRAGALMYKLKSKNIQRIYVTQYKRTQMTGDSLRIQLGIDTAHYKADTTGEDIYNKIIANSDGGKTILIIGHSNTILRIIKKFGIINYPHADIPDAEFDNLYLVTYKRNKAVIKAMKYGVASAASAAMQKL